MRAFSPRVYIPGYHLQKGGTDCYILYLPLSYLDALAPFSLPGFLSTHVSVLYCRWQTRWIVHPPPERLSPCGVQRTTEFEFSVASRPHIELSVRTISAGESLAATSTITELLSSERRSFQDLYSYRSIETVRTIRDSMATSVFTQLLSS